MNFRIVEVLLEHGFLKTSATSLLSINGCILFLHEWKGCCKYQVQSITFLWSGLYVVALQVLVLVTGKQLLSERWNERILTNVTFLIIISQGLLSAHFIFSQSAGCISFPAVLSNSDSFHPLSFQSTVCPFLHTHYSQHSSCLCIRQVLCFEGSACVPFLPR